MNDVCDRLWIEATQFTMACDFHVLQKLPNSRMGEAVAIELFVRYLAIDQRYRRNVRQAVVCCFACFGFPFLRLAPDDVHRGIVAFDGHRFYLRRIANVFSQSERSFDGALAMIFRRPEFDAGFQNHLRRALEFLAYVAQRNAKFLFEPHLPLEDWGGTGHACPRKQSRVNTTPGSISECHAFPVR